MILNLFQYQKQSLPLLSLIKTYFWIKNTLVAMEVTAKVHKSRQNIKQVPAKYHFPAFSLIVRHLIKYGWPFDSCLVMNLI